MTCQYCESHSKLENNSCTQVCSEAEYFHETKTCQAKPENCLEAHLSGFCTKPADGYYIFEGKPISCSSEIANCSHCIKIRTTSNTNLTMSCKKCSGAMKMDRVSNTCVEGCPSNTYYTIFDDCRLLPEHCKSVDLYGKCLEVEDGYYL